MKRLLRLIFVWFAVPLAAAAVYWVFARLVGMPIAFIIAVSLCLTWLLPRPTAALLLLAAVGEAVSITRPLAVTAGVVSPLLIFWLRGRISADLSFSFAILIAASAALSLGAAVAIAVYPFLTSIPWPTVLLAWIAVTLLCAGVTMLLPSVFSRFLHDRYR